MSSRGTKVVLDDSFVANEALTQYQAVVYDTSEEGHIAKPTTALETCAGIVQEKATASGDVVRVVQIGKSKVIAGQADTIDEVIGIHDVDGRVSCPDTADWASGDGIIGHYEESPTASGDIVTAYINIHQLIGMS